MIPSGDCGCGKTGTSAPQSVACQTSRGSDTQAQVILNREPSYNAVPRGCWSMHTEALCWNTVCSYPLCEWPECIIRGGAEITPVAIKSQHEIALQSYGNIPIGNIGAPPLLRRGRPPCIVKDANVRTSREQHVKPGR